VTTDAAVVLAEREAPFWGFGEVCVVLAVSVLTFAVVGSIAASLLQDSARVGYWAVLEESVSYLVIFAVMKALFSWHGQPLLRSLAFVNSPFRARTLVYTGLGLVALSVIIANLARTPDVQTPFQDLLNGGESSRLAIALFGITLGPMVEELIFRGFLQPVFVNSLGVFPGILLTSVMFGALHLQQNANIWQSGVVISLAGFGFGIIRHLSGSTRASTLTHISYNLVPCVATLLEPFHK